VPRTQPTFQWLLPLATADTRALIARFPTLCPRRRLVVSDQSCLERLLAKYGVVILAVLVYPFPPAPGNSRLRHPPTLPPVLTEGAPERRGEHYCCPPFPSVPPHCELGSHDARPQLCRPRTALPLTGRTSRRRTSQEPECSGISRLCVSGTSLSSSLLRTHYPAGYKSGSGATQDLPLWLHLTVAGTNAHLPAATP
jgi:hypothetical protein